MWEKVFNTPVTSLKKEDLHWHSLSPEAKSTFGAEDPKAPQFPYSKGLDNFTQKLWLNYILSIT